jgi:hypothetical protein
MNASFLSKLLYVNAFFRAFSFSFIVTCRKYEANLRCTIMFCASKLQQRSIIWPETYLQVGARALTAAVVTDLTVVSWRAANCLS